MVFHHPHTRLFRTVRQQHVLQRDVPVRHAPCVQVLDRHADLVHVQLRRRLRKLSALHHPVKQLAPHSRLAAQVRVRLVAPDPVDFQDEGADVVVGPSQELIDIGLVLEEKVLS